MTRFGVYLALVCLKTVIAFNLVSWSKSLAMNGRNVALQPFKHAKKPLNMVQYSVDDGILAQMVEDRDACGVGFILASLNQKRTHSILKQALNALGCMEHRGATSADNVSGDGAGVSTDIPWKLFDKVDLDKVTRTLTVVSRLLLHKYFSLMERNSAGQCNSSRMSPRRAGSISCNGVMCPLMRMFLVNFLVNSFLL